MERKGKGERTRNVEVARHERFEERDLSWDRKLVGPGVFGLWREEKVVVPVVGVYSRGDSSENLGRYWGLRKKKKDTQASGAG
jgi:hypothetical protein